MTVRTSSAREVNALVEQLHSPVAVERDTAVARLRVMGARARDRVLRVIGDVSAARDARIAAVGILNAVEDGHAKHAAIAATADPDAGVAVAAIQALRPCLSQEEDASALEAITGVVTDDSRQTEVRRAALDALSELPAHLTAPLVQSVGPQLAATPPLEDARSAAEWLGSHEDAPLGLLHDIVSHARDRQREAAEDGERGAWLALRAAAHALLARRVSRIALYDAREMFDRAQSPLPLELLVTMRTIGDTGCLESLARSWQSIPDDSWWRSQVQDAAAAIVKRDRATARHAVIRRIKAKWPGFLV